MARYARLQAGIVVEVLTLPDSVQELVSPVFEPFIDDDGQPQPGAAAKYRSRAATIEDFLHPDIAAQCVPCGEDVAERWLYSDGAFKAPPPPEVDLTAVAAQVRYRKETAGIAIDGSVIATDRESQAMIHGAYNFVQANPAATVRYKAATGFVTFDKAAVETIALTVGAHVQACFAKEAEVIDAIETGAITTVAEVEAAFASL